MSYKLMSKVPGGGGGGCAQVERYSEVVQSNYTQNLMNSQGLPLTEEYQTQKAFDHPFASSDNG
jgi:hypothetical protein